LAPDFVPRSTGCTRPRPPGPPPNGCAASPRCRRRRLPATPLPRPGRARPPRSPRCPSLAVRPGCRGRHQPAGRSRRRDWRSSAVGLPPSRAGAAARAG